MPALTQRVRALAVHVGVRHPHSRQALRHVDRYPERYVAGPRNGADRRAGAVVVAPVREQAVQRELLVGPLEPKDTSE